MSKDVVLPGLPEFVVLSGLQGSGKTTEALQWIAEDPEWRRRMNYDDLRIELYGTNWKWNRQEEEQMKLVARERVTRWLEDGFSVIVDNTNLSRKVRSAWLDLGKSLGAECIEQDMGTYPWDCARRDALRHGSARVGRGVIDRAGLFYGYYDWDEFKRDFIIVDIDGTVADCEHRKHHIQVYCKKCGPDANTSWSISAKGAPIQCSTCDGVDFSRKDWKSFHSAENILKDPPIQPIIDLVKLLSNNYDVIYLTGRSTDNGCGIATEDWLNGQGILDLNDSYTPLFMRAAGDHRPDIEAKKEILDLLPKNRIRYVLDDRDRVVKMYRDAGLTALQVSEGSY